MGIIKEKNREKRTFPNNFTMHVSPLRQKAFPFGEGVGIADERGHSLPLWGRCRLCRRKRTLPSPFGEGVGIADGRGLCLPIWGRCRHCRRKRTLPSPFGEGVGFADGIGYCLPLLGKVLVLPTEEDYATESVPPRRSISKF